jgi:hypothetical protein
LLADGIEMGGGVFPPVPDPDAAYADAVGEGEAWLQDHPPGTAT